MLASFSAETYNDGNPHPDQNDTHALSLDSSKIDPDLLSALRVVNGSQAITERGLLLI